jgi:hypothetical protein
LENKIEKEMNIGKKFQDSLDKEFGALMGNPDFSSKSGDIMKGRSEYNESEEMSEKWSEKYKKSIDCNNPKGFSQKAFCQGKKKKESKEATSAGSAGQYSQPLFSEINENMTKSDYQKLQKVLDIIFKDDFELYKKVLSLVTDEYKHKFSDIEDLLDTSKKGTNDKVKERLKKLRGNLPDVVTIEDLVNKNLKKGKSISTIEKKVKSAIKKGTKVEMEHTDDKKVAEEIAMDHLYEDLEYYEKLSKIEANEATSSSSSGQYSTPKIWAKSMKKKDWRGASKTQIPGGKFVTVKEKCRKFPYCNQGDIKALNIFENETLKKVISNLEKKYNISENVIRYVILSEIKNNKDIYK